LNWSASAVLRQAAWGQGGLAAALILTGLAMDSVARQNTVGALLPGAGGLLVLLLGIMGLWSARGLVQTPLPPGELRDRLFELSEERASTLQEAYLLPATQWRCPALRVARQHGQPDSRCGAVADTPEVDAACWRWACLYREATLAAGGLVRRGSSLSA
jgi:hypothetical protein